MVYAKKLYSQKEARIKYANDAPSTQHTVVVIMHNELFYQHVSTSGSSSGWNTFTFNEIVTVR
jgi:hypothetical protein